MSTLQLHDQYPSIESPEVIVVPARRCKSTLKYTSEMESEATNDYDFYTLRIFYEGLYLPSSEFLSEKDCREILYEAVNLAEFW